MDNIELNLCKIGGDILIAYAVKWIDNKYVCIVFVSYYIITHITCNCSKV